MDKITTTGCYLPVDFVTELAAVHKNFDTGEHTFEICIEKHTGMIVLTKEQYEQVLQLPVLFVKYIITLRNNLESPDWTHDKGDEDIYKYWLENIYQPEK